MVMPCGRARVAVVAAAVSPEKAAVPVPAMVVMMPVAAVIGGCGGCGCRRGRGCSRRRGRGRWVSRWWRRWRGRVAGEALSAGAGDGGDDSGGGDFADAVVAGVGEVEVVGGVEGEGGGEVELGGGGEGVVAGEAWGAVPAMVVMMPVVRLSLRMRWLWVSAM